MKGTSSVASPDARPCTSAGRAAQARLSVAHFQALHAWPVDGTLQMEVAICALAPHALGEPAQRARETQPVPVSPPPALSPAHELPTSTPALPEARCSVRTWCTGLLEWGAQRGRGPADTVRQEVLSLAWEARPGRGLDCKAVSRDGPALGCVVETATWQQGARGGDVAQDAAASATASE